MKTAKKIAALVLALVMLIYIFPVGMSASADEDYEGYKVKITGATVNVRSGAGSGYKRIGTAAKNRTFEYLGSARDSSGCTWYKVQYSASKTGWITSRYSKLVAASSSGSTSTASKVKITAASVNVRKGAGGGYGKIGVAKKNQTYTYLDSKKASNGRVWYKIQFTPTKTGWITSQYATLIKANSTTTTVTTTTAATTTTATTTTATTTAAVSSATDADTTTTTTATTTATTTTTTTTTTIAVNSAYNYTLSRGSSGTKVTKMQKRLKTLGYISETADGDFGKNTERAVRAFQTRAGLEVTGIADPVTLTLLYSSRAPKAPATSNHADVLNPDYEKDYYVIVYKKNCKVLVLGKDPYGKYNQVVKCFNCSVGRSGHSTPSGVFTVSVRYKWRLLSGNVYGQYAVRFYGNYLFHSVPYYTQSASNLKMGEFEKLGNPASLGCVRLCVRDSKWIYDNVKSGTKVRVLAGKNCTEQAEEIPELNYSKPYYGWDPTDPNSKNPYNS